MIDQEIKQLIDNATTIGITSHVRPDGDAIGSLLGLGLALDHAGKQVQMVLRDGVSRTFRHLPGADKVKRSFSEVCNLYIAVDSSDLKRTGDVFGGHKTDIVIDHHITNDHYGKVNLIDDSAVATCEILAVHIPNWGLEISQDVAANLLTGIISDSIGFRTTNTTSRSLRTAANLMETGVNNSELHNKALLSRSFEAANYWGYALGRLERNEGLVWTTLTLEDRRDSKYHGDDDADLTNILSSIEGIDIAVLFIEQSADQTKVSWRSRLGVNVSGIALSLGGGGHPAAAGADLHGSLSEVKEKVLKITLDYLESLESDSEINQGLKNGVRNGY